MSTLNYLEIYNNDITKALTVLTEHFSTVDASSESGLSLPIPSLAVSDDAPAEVHRARRQVLTTIARLQFLLSEPADFVQRLATQTQLLGCLQWLGEFQVLASIPLTSSVPIRDIADLVGVPETELCRIVRMTATAGFLREPQPGCVAHTALSAAFVTNLSHLDAAMFLAENVGPAALRMSSATQRYCSTETRNNSAYSIALNTSQTFYSASEQRPKLKRQWPAYLQCVGAAEDGIPELLSQLDWQSLGNSCIVDAGPSSTKMSEAIAQEFPDLHFIVQLRETSSTNNGWGGHQFQPSIPNPIINGTKRDENVCHNITVSTRSMGSPQTVKGAAMYILHIDSPSSTILSGSHPASILSELRAHLAVLHENPLAKLLLVTWLLPAAGAVDPEVETSARLRDLSLTQLVNKREMEMGELVEIINHLKGGQGRLIVVDKLRSASSGAALLSVRYQPQTLFQGSSING